jgi:hypothetical protein
MQEQSTLGNPVGRLLAMLAREAGGAARRLGRTPGFVAVAILTLAMAAAAAQEPQDIPKFASKVELVTVDAVVQDAKGRPVRGLTAADFTLVEDGQSQTITSFEAVDLGDTADAGPRAAAGPVATNARQRAAAAGSYVLLVDDVSLSPTRQTVVREALARFVDTSLRDGDEVIFATTSGDAWWSARMPEGREDIHALAGRVRGRNLTDSFKDAVSEWEAFRIESFEGKGDPGAPDPAAHPGRQPGTTSSAVPGATVTERVVERYYQGRVCNPDPIPGDPAGPPMTSPTECRGMVHARAQLVNQRRLNRTRDVLAAVDRSVFALTGLRGRKALLLFTEGFLNDPELGAVQEVAGRCREANLVLYSLDVRGLMTGGITADSFSVPVSGEVGGMKMEETELVAAGSVGLAEDTGGFAVRNTNDLGAGAARVAEESRTYYLLGYTPPEGKGPRDWRKLKVQVDRPDLKVRARKGYTLRTSAEIAQAAEAKPAPKAEGSKPGSPEPAKVPADVARSLANARDADAIPLRAMAYALEGRPAGTVRTLIAVETDTHRVANVGEEERPQAILTLSILATHRDSGKTQRIDQYIVVDSKHSKVWEGWLALSREFDLPPGVAQARVVVRDEFLGRVGAVTVRFVVPQAAGLRISTPILTDRLLTAAEGAGALPVLLAHREFASSANLYCQFQVFGAGGVNPPARVIEASYELRRANGDVLRQGVQSPIARSADGSLVRLLAFTLDGMGAGDYELVLRIRDQATGQTEERVEPLRIAPRAG